MIEFTILIVPTGISKVTNNILDNALKKKILKT